MLNYAVLNFPEALWPSLELTYRVYQPTGTIWSERQIVLEQLGWQRDEQGNSHSVRRFPGGIEIGVVV